MSLPTTDHELKKNMSRLNNKSSRLEVQVSKSTLLIPRGNFTITAAAQTYK